MKSTININNVINVTISSPPRGLEIPNVNNLALFTNDPVAFQEDFRVYRSAQDVAQDFGFDSLTTKMCQNIFAQAPNFLSGGGQLTILKTSGVGAKYGSLKTIDMAANIANFSAVKDGEFTLVVDGVSQDYTALDFSNVKTIADLILFLEKILPVEIIEESGKLKFNSKTVGATSAVTMAAVTGGSGTDLTGATFFDASNAVVEAGADSSGEKLQDALLRTENMVNYCGVLTTLSIEDSSIPGLASYIQAKDLILMLPFSHKNQLDSVVKTIADSSQNKTRCLFYSDGIEKSKLFLAAYVGRMFSVNFFGSNTVQTANLKLLKNIEPDGGIDQTTYNKLKDVGADAYVSYNGLPRTLSSGGNMYFDRVYNQQQLKFFLQTEGFNYLATTQTKIPQTEPGMDGLKGAFKNVCELFTSNGFIGKGLRWASPDKFGDPENFDRNILELGYYIYSLPIAQQLQSEREQRVAPIIQIAVKESGAIHSAIINVYSEA